MRSFDRLLFEQDYVACQKVLADVDRDLKRVESYREAGIVSHIIQEAQSAQQRFKATLLNGIDALIEVSDEAEDRHVAFKDIGTPFV
jgi:hypothetical protein